MTGAAEWRAAAIARQVDAALREHGDPARAEQERRYLKSELEHYGVTVPTIRKVAYATLREHQDLGHDDVVALAEALWTRRVHEDRMAAVEVLDAGSDRLGPADLPLLEGLLRGARTWALVDGLAASVVGSIVERHREDAGVAGTLDRWARDDDFWLRRSALLALLGPLRHGGGDVDRFLRYADDMLDERESFVAKAIGWVLRDMSRRRPEIVAAWLRPRAARASAVTVREAVKYLSDDDRTSILSTRGSPRRRVSSRAGRDRAGSRDRASPDG